MIDEYTPDNPRDGPEEHPSYLPDIMKSPNGLPIGKLYSVLVDDDRLPAPIIFQGTATYEWMTPKNTVRIQIDHFEEFKKVRKPFLKLFMFFLNKTVNQGFPDIMNFSLNELVEIGMYTRASSARTAVVAFARTQGLIKIERTYKKNYKRKKETVFVHSDAFFSCIETDSKVVLCRPNNELISLAVCSEYTILPRFSFSLSNNGYLLVWYIFYLSRQNLLNIKEKGFFTISLGSIQCQLGLPSVRCIRNREYKKQIIDPILLAIHEVQDAFVNFDEAPDLHVSIEVHTCSTSNIEEWLNGYITIYMDNPTSKGYQKIINRAEQWQKNLEEKKERARKKALGESHSAE